MTPWLVLLGGIFAFAVPTIVAAFFQMSFFNPPVSDNWAPLTEQAIAAARSTSPTAASTATAATPVPRTCGTGLYYLYPRVSLPGDFATSDEAPNVFGTARIGPDLSQEGGFHPDDWHRAHFSDAASSRPNSLMPRFELLHRSADRGTRGLRAVEERQERPSAAERPARHMKDLHPGVDELPRPAPALEADALTCETSRSCSKWATENGHQTLTTGGEGHIDGLAYDELMNMICVDRSYWLADNPCR